MKHLKTFESYKDTAWTKNGKTITIQQVYDYLNKINAPVIDMSVQTIALMCIHVNKKDKVTKERVEKSNLSYPIIIVKSGNNYTKILDGHHRLMKAINHEKEFIKARILDLDNAPAEFKEIFK